MLYNLGMFWKTFWDITNLQYFNNEHVHERTERTDGLQKSLMQKAEALRLSESQLRSCNLATISPSLLDEAEEECRNVQELLMHVQNVARLTGSSINCFGIEHSSERLEALIESWRSVLAKQKRLQDFINSHPIAEETEKKSEEIQWWLDDHYEDEDDDASDEADWKTK